MTTGVDFEHIYVMAISFMLSSWTTVNLHLMYSEPTHYFLFVLADRICNEYGAAKVPD